MAERLPFGYRGRSVGRADDFSAAQCLVFSAAQVIARGPAGQVAEDVASLKSRTQITKLSTEEARQSGGTSSGEDDDDDDENEMDTRCTLPLVSQQSFSSLLCRVAAAVAAAFSEIY